jgi:glutamine cyclotransferase
MKKLLSWTLVIVALAACHNSENSSTDNENISAAIPTPKVMNYSIMKIYPHDSTSYTEGLVWMNNLIYESGGQYKESRLQKSVLETGKVLQSVKLTNDFFGEGISIINNKIYQLVLCLSSPNQIGKSGVLCTS